VKSFPVAAMTSDVPVTTAALHAGALCRRVVITVAEGEDISAAARLMREMRVGDLVVTDVALEAALRKGVGVLTDRDIVVAVVASETEPRSLRVGDVMTRTPLLVGEDYLIDAVLRFMRDAGVRRVPVVGKQGELVGVLSLDDVLRSIAEQLASIAGSIRCERQNERLLRT
jgi:CBS domain-containing protein